MLSAANPETTVASTYTYFNNGALKKRTDGRGTVTYEVDGLNRVTRKTYTGGEATPEAVYCYDGKAYVGGECSAVTRDDYAWGAMTGHGTAVSSARLDLIHPLGLVEKSSQSVVGLSEPKVMQYEYNAGGAITKATYPSGRVVGYTVGTANRVLSIRNGTTGSDYYQSTATYGPHGAMTAATMGEFSQSWQYTSRLQVREMTATAGGIEYKFGLCYSGNCDNTVENESNNNGNLLRETLITTGRTTIARNYVYDAANRVTSYTEAAKSQGYGYDGFGNLWQTAASEVPALAPNGSAWYLQSGSGVVNNRYNGVQYTDAGDVTQYSLNGGPWEQVYDGEGRLLRVEQAGGTKMVEYDYDAEGRRVRRVAGAVTTHFAYDAGGQLMGEYGGPVAATGRQYLVADHLGSTRMVVSGGVCVNRFDYAPFGGEVDRAGEPCYGSSAEPRQKFTGKERDQETGLDYFGARYMSAAQGRFTSADAPFADQHPEEPQSWNLYGYVRNNPLAHVDPNGKACSALNNSSGFCQRADLYTNLDLLVRSKTRFFAAASAASQELADLAVPGFGARAASPDTRAFLESTGQALEKLNLESAGKILSGQMTGSEAALDRSMVHREQTQVQKQLDQFRGANPEGYGTALREINSLLNGTGAKTRGLILGGNLLFSTDKAYSQFLGGVRKSLGHDINFANQKDREAIGNALVQHIRNGGCDVTRDKVTCQ